MSNKPTFYVGKVIEIIRDNQGKPTLELRVRVPTIHGTNPADGVPNDKLPIAKPVVIPGMIVEQANFEAFINTNPTLYILFESGNYTRPVYFGARVDLEKYSIPLISSLDERINEIVDEKILTGVSHDSLSLYSRSLPNQHPISAITGLKEQIDVHIGPDAPENNEKVWFQTTILSGEELLWRPLVSLPVIQYNANFPINISALAPIRLVIIGSINGNAIVQYFENTEAVNKIVGEAIVYVDELTSNAVYFEADITTTNISITVFLNTGNTNITEFTALRFEVYE